jgi:hypothetical protein
MEPHGCIGRPGERDIVHQDSRAPDNHRHRAGKNRDSAECPNRASHPDTQRDDRQRAEHDFGSETLRPRNQKIL